MLSDCGVTVAVKMLKIHVCTLATKCPGDLTECDLPETACRASEVEMGVQCIVVSLSRGVSGDLACGKEVGKGELLD